MGCRWRGELQRVSSIVLPPRLAPHTWTGATRTQAEWLMGFMFASG